MLYIFAMIVFIMIKLKQRRDKQLRDQFLALPMPPGIGYKSSRILGLEDSYLTDMARLQEGVHRGSHRGRRRGACDFHTASGRMGDGGIAMRNQPHPGGRVLEVNAELLEAHRKVLSTNSSPSLYSHKVVESRLQAEVAEGGQCCEGGCVGVRVGSKRRFLPHLEEIPEESRCSTILKERGEKEEEGEESEISEDSGGMGSLEGGSEGGTGKSRQQASMDSGIVTRFG